MGFTDVFVFQRFNFHLKFQTEKKTSHTPNSQQIVSQLCSIACISSQIFGATCTLREYIVCEGIQIRKLH